MSKKENDTYSYKGWLISDNFLKRCLAIVGHYFVGILFIYLVLIGIVIFVLGLRWLVNVFLG